jgi:hypothetical protein
MSCAGPFRGGAATTAVHRRLSQLRRSDPPLHDCLREFLADVVSGRVAGIPSGVEPGECLAWGCRHCVRFRAASGRAVFVAAYADSDPLEDLL